jgi:hypothetical protein
VETTPEESAHRTFEYGERSWSNGKLVLKATDAVAPVVAWARESIRLGPEQAPRHDICFTFYTRARRRSRKFTLFGSYPTAVQPIYNRDQGRVTAFVFTVHADRIEG